MVFIHLRDATTKQRTRLDGVNLGDNVVSVKLLSEQNIGISSSEQRLVFLGKVLDDSKPLSSYGISEGCTVYIFRKINSVNKTQDVVEPAKQSQLTVFLNKVSKNPIFQASIKRILKDADAVKNLIDAIPALQKDPVALALLKDPDLLIQIAETANVEKIMQDHPSITQAASYLTIPVATEIAIMRQQLLAQNHGSELHAMEGIDPGSMARAEMIAAREEALQDQQAARPQQISPMQLALALSQAGVTPQPTTGGQPSARSQPLLHSPLQQTQAASQPPAQPQIAQITSDFFSQAIASAIASTSQPQNATETTSYQAALLQMRDMGIADDSLSLRALTQTNGDVEAALHLIFEGGLQ